MGPGLVLASPSLLPSLPRARPRGCPSRPGTPAGQQGASAPVPEAPFRSPGISVAPRSPRGCCGVQKLPGLNAARSAQQCPGCTGWRAPSKAAAGHRGRAPAAPGSHGPACSRLPAAQPWGGGLALRSLHSFLAVQTDGVGPSFSLSPLPHKFIHMLMASGAGLCTLPLLLGNPARVAGGAQQGGDEVPVKIVNECCSLS